MLPGLPAIRLLFPGSLALVLCLLLLAQSATAAPKPDAAVAPLGLFDNSARLEKKIIHNHFEKRLSEHYRLLSSSQYEKARDKVFETVQTDQCTEKHCIRKIQETLQVERLFFLEITLFENVTQLNITLIRVEDTLLEEQTCRECGLEQLYLMVGGMVDRIAARDMQQKTLPESAASAGWNVVPDTMLQGDAAAARPEFLSTLSRGEIVRHSAALALIAVSAWQSREEASSFNQLADRNKTISAAAAGADSEASYAALQEEYNRNREQMAERRTRILIYDAITLAALVWEGWQIYRTVGSPAEAHADGLQSEPHRRRPGLHPLLNPALLTAGFSVSWNW